MDAKGIDRGAARRSPNRTIATVLLSCGVASMVVYIAGDVLASMRWASYRYADRSVSELIAVGSPTRSFIVWPMAAYNVLILAFAIGVLTVVGARRSTRIAGILLTLYGIVSTLGLLAFPLRPDSAISDPSVTLPLSGSLHVAVTIAQVLLMFLFIGFGAVAHGKGFRWYSIATFALVLVGGVLAGGQVGRAAAGLPTPGLGLLERANIYSSLIWVAVFALVLLREEWRPADLARGSGARAGAKKVAVIVGSPHRGGATFSAARKLVENLESYGDVTRELVMLGDYDIGVCKGCKACFNRGEEYCPLKDDRDAIIEKMMAADAVVFASPNYSWQVSGLLKVFLDRIGFAFHRPQFHGKTASSIVVQGIGFGGRIRKYLEFVEGGLGFKVVKGSVITTLEPMTEKALRRMDDTLDELGRRLHEQLMRPAYPAPSLFELMMFRMGRTGIKLNAPRDKRDWGFYRDKGWFESDYYYPTNLAWPKRVLGAFFDWIVAATGMFSVAQPDGGRDKAPMQPAS